LRHSFKNIR